MEKIQIGVFNVPEDKEFLNNGFACAAWYEKVLVKAGQYPILGELNSDGTVDYKSVSIQLPGVITASDFSSHFGGLRIGSKVDEEVGKESRISLRPYAFSVAEAILKGDSQYELFPEFAARQVDFTFAERPCTTRQIYRKEAMAA